MTPPCVCSHPAWAHFASDGMCFDCGCSYFTEDGENADPGPLSVLIPASGYSGIYKGPYRLGGEPVSGSSTEIVCGVCRKTWSSGCPACGG